MRYRTWPSRLESSSAERRNRAGRPYRPRCGRRLSLSCSRWVDPRLSLSPLPEPRWVELIGLWDDTYCSLLLGMRVGSTFAGRLSTAGRGRVALAPRTRGGALRRRARAPTTATRSNLKPPRFMKVRQSFRATGMRRNFGFRSWARGWTTQPSRGLATAAERSRLGDGPEEETAGDDPSENEQAPALIGVQRAVRPLVLFLPAAAAAAPAAVFLRRGVVEYDVALLSGAVLRRSAARVGRGMGGGRKVRGVRRRFGRGRGAVRVGGGGARGAVRVRGGGLSRRLVSPADLAESGPLAPRRLTILTSFLPPSLRRPKLSISGILTCPSSPCVSSRSAGGANGRLSAPGLTTTSAAAGRADGSGCSGEVT